MTEGAALERDAIIGGRYRLCRRLGEGGMGWVWEASHVFTHARFALKFLKGARDEDRRRFVREVRAAAAVKHPNVIAVHDFVELPDGTLVMVMDLLEGETLGQLLERERRIALAPLAATLLPVLSALEAAHGVGIVHRDLKPDNIFLSETEGKDIEVKVLDFGVAKLTALDGLAARTQALTSTGAMVGTPYYMAPEQVVAEHDLDARADIWSLGIVMYECLAGVRPTEADNVGRVLKRILLAEFEPITAHCKDLPEDVTSLVAKMLIGDREKRTRDLADVRAVLERHAASRVPASARPVGSEHVDVHADTVATAPTGRGETNRAVALSSAEPSRRRARLVAAAGVALLGGAAVVGWSAVPPTKAPVGASPTMPTVSTEMAALPSAAIPAAAPEIASDRASGPALASATATGSGPVVMPRPRPAPTRPAIAGAPGTAPAVPVSKASPLAPVPVASMSAQATPPKPPPGFAASRKE